MAVMEQNHSIAKLYFSGYNYIIMVPPRVRASMKPLTMAVLRAVPNSSNEYLETQ